MIQELTLFLNDMSLRGDRDSHKFITGILDKTNGGKETDALSSYEIAWVMHCYRKYLPMGDLVPGIGFEPMTKAL